MKLDYPAIGNPIDRLKVVGRSTERVDGPLKTTGQARYAYEQNEAAPNAAYGYVLGAAIAKGRNWHAHAHVGCKHEQAIGRIAADSHRHGDLGAVRSNAAMRRRQQRTLAAYCITYRKQLHGIGAPSISAQCRRHAWLELQFAIVGRARPEKLPFPDGPLVTETKVPYVDEACIRD